MDKNQIVSFANQAKFALDNKLSRCVDGRYENIEIFPAVAKPGADAGDVLVAFSALNNLNIDVPSEQVFQAVVDAGGGQDNFRFHTDSHAEHDQKSAGMGCGHLKFAHQNPGSYELRPEQTQFLMDMLEKIARENSACQVVLQGDHAETAVIVIDSDHYSLKPLVRNGSGIQEAFIYQKSLHDQQLNKLAGILALKTGSTVEQVETELHKALDKQLGETLKNLASDKPVYTVQIDQRGAVEVK